MSAAALLNGATVLEPSTMTAPLSSVPLSPPPLELFLPPQPAIASAASATPTSTRPRSTLRFTSGLPFCEALFHPDRHQRTGDTGMQAPRYERLTTQE